VHSGVGVRVHYQQRYGRRRPVVRAVAGARNALVVLLASVLAFALAKTSAGRGVHTFTLIGYMPGGLPTPSVPHVDAALLPSAAVVALVGFLESYSIAGSFGRKNGYCAVRVRVRQVAVRDVMSAFLSLCV